VYVGEGGKEIGIGKWGLFNEWTKKEHRICQVRTGNAHNKILKNYIIV
jgi:hypothetical protein